jgi:hypothetical protein
MFRSWRRSLFVRHGSNSDKALARGASRHFGHTNGTLTGISYFPMSFLLPIHYFFSKRFIKKANTPIAKMSDNQSHTII